jgi:mRNA interferase MazF
MTEQSIKRGEVWKVKLDPTQGSEMQKTRPSVVVSNDVINERSAVVMICPVTGFTNKAGRIHIFVPKGDGGLEKDSLVHCGQMRAVDKTRLVYKMGVLSESKMAEIQTGLSIVLDLPRP